MIQGSVHAWLSVEGERRRPKFERGFSAAGAAYDTGYLRRAINGTWKLNDIELVK